MNQAQKNFLASFASPQTAESMREIEELHMRAGLIPTCRPDLTQKQVFDHVVELGGTPRDRDYWMRICLDRALAAAPMPWEAGFFRLPGLVGLPSQKLSVDELSTHTLRQE